MMLMTSLACSVDLWNGALMTKASIALAVGGEVCLPDTDMTNNLGHGISLFRLHHGAMPEVQSLRGQSIHEDHHCRPQR